MKILFVLEYFPPHIWGVEVLFENLISWLLQQWHTITVLTSKFSKDVPAYEHKHPWYEIYRVWHNRYDFIFFALGEGRRLAKNADIVHTTTYTGSIPWRLLAKYARKKIVITVHEIFGHLWKQFVGSKRPIYRAIEHMIFWMKFDTYICVSDYTRHMLHNVEKIPYDTMVTIYNGINYSLRQPSVFYDLKATELRTQYWLDKTFVGIFFWRPWISKWLEYFVRAMPIIVKKIPEFMAYLLVSNDDKARFDYIVGIAKELWVEQYIIWWSKVSYDLLPAYVSMADVTVVPSLTEWFWFSAVEACSMGKPVVVSRAGALPEVVSGNVIFAEPANSKSIAAWVIKAYEKQYTTIPTKKFSRDANVVLTQWVYDSLV